MTTLRLDRHSRFNRRTIVTGALAAPIAGAALLGAPRALRLAAQDDPVRIGSKDFPEQFILSEMFAALLDSNGIAVNTDAINLGGTGIAHSALDNDEIDLYAEYTGTAYTVIFDLPFPPEDVDDTEMATPEADGSFTATDLRVYDAIVDAYAELGLVVLDQTPFNNNQAIALQRAFAEENGLSTLSDLAAWGEENDIVISAPVDFEERPDGLPGLQEVYGGGFDTADVLGIDPGLKYDALESGDANVVLAFGTDAEIGAFDLVVMRDDQGLFPPGHVAPIVRQEAIDAYPEIPELLNSVIPLLTNDTQIALNAAVVLDGRDSADVAREFLIDNDLIEG